MPKKVSVDEFLGTRKGFVTDDGIILKAAKAPSSYNSSQGTCRFVMSTEAPDRDRDVVLQAGLDVTEFLKNPIAPFGHRSADFPVGSWEDISKVLTGRPKRTEGTLRLTEGDPVADRLKTHLAAGTIRACSIGFMPKDIELRELSEGETWTGFSILSSELYECSPVAIPAQPQALAKAAEANGLLPAEVIEEVLDTWTMVSGLLMPRKDFEAEYAKHSVGKTFSFAGRQIKVLENGGAEVATAPAAPENTLLKRLAKVLGLGDDASKDPTSLQDLLVKSAPAEGEQPSPPTSSQEETPAPAAPIIPDDDVKVLEEMEETIMLEAEHALLSEDIKKALAA